MVDYDLLFAIIFFGLILIIILKNKDKFIIQNKIIAIYKTQLGIKLMDKIAKKFPRILNILSYISITIGFIGMILILFLLTKGTLELLFVPDAPPPIAPVFPKVTIPGLPPLSFWHWIISIFIVALVHEFSHGIFARLYNLKVKSAGIAFIGPILAAFVEPDENQLKKTSKKNQLAIISAGPFSNFIFFIIFLLIAIFVMNPINDKIFDQNGIVVNEIVENYPISKTDLKIPFTIVKVNEIETLTMADFKSAFENIKPNDNVIITTSTGESITVKAVENPNDKTKGYIGIGKFTPAIKNTLTKFRFLGNITIWLSLLIFWLYTINIGVGLFNLFPLGPIDGGRMFSIFTLWIFKDNDQKAMKLCNFMSLFCLLLLFINLLPWLGKLITFLFKPILFLIALI